MDNITENGQNHTIEDWIMELIAVSSFGLLGGLGAIFNLLLICFQLTAFKETQQRKQTFKNQQTDISLDMGKARLQDGRDAGQHCATGGAGQHWATETWRIDQNEE
uniref:Uncharacterized protein n=1 Tax=Romanomermis culicivorax TaxID=13658 RepID=A0A915IVZ3_ROMCU